MRVEHIEILVEEPSMEVALRLLLPKVLGDVSFEVYPYQCKDELLLRLPERLHGYVLRRANDAWFRDCCRIIVVLDRDDDDCVGLKHRLEEEAARVGMVTRARAGAGAYALVNRLAIEELEAWYFGDWEAVRAAYPGAPASVPAQAKYRRPDEIAGGTWEAFERIMQKAGYFRGGLRKIQAAQAIAAQMDPERNTSPSFRALRDVLQEMTAS